MYKVKMHEQRGLFKSIDTCDVKNLSDFSYTSKILDIKNALLDYKLCVLPAFSFPAQIPNFTPNSIHYMPNFL